jgi:hypothetical protein
VDRSGPDVFEPVLGLPSWLVRKGIGSFITLEFGDPTLTIRDPKPWTARTATGEALSTRRRQTSVHGEWHQWMLYPARG